MCLVFVQNGWSTNCYSVQGVPEGSGLFTCKWSNPQGYQIGLHPLVTWWQGQYLLFSSLSAGLSVWGAGTFLFLVYCTHNFTLTSPPFPVFLHFCVQELCNHIWLLLLMDFSMIGCGSSHENEEKDQHWHIFSRIVIHVNWSCNVILWMCRWNCPTLVSVHKWRKICRRGSR